VLPLSEALARLRARELPAKSVSITIDDGFYSVLAQAAPILREFRMPATLYVTSYYVLKRAPIFGLAVQYLIWKTALRGIDLAPLAIPSLNQADLTTTAARDAVANEIMHFGGRLPDEPARQELCHRLAALLDIDYEAIITSRQLSLLTQNELALLADFGIDVELHTHRHRLSSTDEAEMVREIRDNRAVLEPAIGRNTRHFCYPSGEWSAAQWPLLASENVLSATTCDPGLNHPDTPPLGLYRTLDANDMSQVAIDAELHGFGDLVRTLSGRRRFTDAARGSTR
jgi:peptidoglycan/xylan/chitin deacetylase (PgdA/CDA1 family)